MRVADFSASASASASTSNDGENKSQSKSEEEEEEEEERRVTSSVLALLVAAGIGIFPYDNPEPAIAGFGAPEAASSSPPLPANQLEFIIGMDRKAAIRRTSIMRTSDFDILLQELNALIQLDEKALEVSGGGGAALFFFFFFGRYLFFPISLHFLFMTEIFVLRNGTVLAG